MIDTISLCNICYKRIQAFIYPNNGQAWMKKTCDVHGQFKAMVDPSWQHVSNFYRYGTSGNNNAIIVHIHDGCNMKCSWCYYPPGVEKIKNFEFYDSLLWESYGKRGFSLMFSGGEPTLRPDYHAFVTKAWMRGWNPSTITNMISLADEDFFANTIAPPWLDENGNYRFAMSMQHPNNYSPEIYELKIKALENIDKMSIRASCVMFSIESLDELDFIKEFYDKYRHLFHMLRIRTLFHNWGNKGFKKIFLSDLHTAFLEKFEEYCPIQSSKIEQSNIYCLYMETKEMRNISISSSPTVENLDYHLCSRPVYMLALDERAYPVPIAQIINEGIQLGWKDGYKLDNGGVKCG